MMDVTFSALSPFQRPGLLAGDGENEFVADLEGIRLDYVKAGD